MADQQYQPPLQQPGYHPNQPMQPPQFSPPPGAGHQFPPPQQPPPQQQQYPQQQQQPQQQYPQQQPSPQAVQPFPTPPAQRMSVSAGSTPVIQDTLGSFNGGSYRIDHRDCNTLLSLQLAQGCPVQAKPGAMVAMSPTVTLKGSIKFSFKKMFAGGEMAHSTFTGPGDVLLAPAALGDIAPIRLDGNQMWNVGKDGFLCCTENVIREMKSQGFGKAMFSGEGLFLYKFSGNGVLFVTSLGAIVQKNLGPGESYIIDNDHLVAWNCKYVIERVASGGIISSMSSSEGVVCRFTGPGTVFFQTRNPTALGAWIASHMPSSGGYR